MPTQSRRIVGAPVHQFGMLSTYPPKLCGLATFAAALANALRNDGHRVDVVRVQDGDEPAALGHTVVGELVNGSATSLRHAAAILSRCDSVIIQHEYGIFGGEDGDEVVQLLHALTVPAIVVLHTVPLQPTPHQRTVLEAVCAEASSVVVMTETAAGRLRSLYTVDDEIVAVIPHGAALAPLTETGPELAGRARPQLLTWGLLGPGKGVEHVIDALALLTDLHPRLRYTVAGVTHPKVFAAKGDEYRHALMRRAWSSGVAGSVHFDDTYRNVAQLTRFVAASSLVILPYDSRDQVTSGVLVDAIAAGKPVIATAFPHAVELQDSGAVMVVPHGDPDSLADAIRSVMCDPVILSAMTEEARLLAPSLSWAAVAEQYVRLSTQLGDIDAPVAM